MEQAPDPNSLAYGVVTPNISPVTQVMYEGEKNNKLVEQFLKTAMALNCFDEAMYHLNDKFNDYGFLYQVI